MPHEFRRRVVLAGVVAACIGASAAIDRARRAHHRGNRFQNNYLEFEPKGLGALIEWRVAAAREGLPHPPADGDAARRRRPRLHPRQRRRRRRR